MKQKVVTEVRRITEQTKQRRAGRPHKSISRHLRFFARSLVLEDRQKGKAEHFARRSKKEMAALLAHEFGFSENPKGDNKVDGAIRAIRRARKKTELVLRERLKWCDCVLFINGDSWLVYFVCGFNPMVAHEYRYTPSVDTERISIAPPVNWYVVYHWEYMEPTVNRNNPAEIGIRRRIDDVVECKPFFLKLPGINVLLEDF